VDDHSASVTDRQPSSQRHTAEVTLTVFSLAFTLLALLICLIIELLNAQAGFPLPRDFNTDSGKWRVSYVTSETQWRKSQSAADPSLLTRSLSPGEFAEMRRTVHAALANFELRNAVESAGLVQYPLTFALLFSLPFEVLKFRDQRRRITLSICLVIAIMCACLMFYRGYFTSLGW
jgi:hypothetical protein